ncbi:MerR family transcriptional regulator [Streptomyces sp. NPDC002766]|uniref:MerR family transcriptional regulator n=1 Tax=unclassified Streptomyces TaxID=2593676 RepID=UPI00331CA0FB
MPADNAPAAGNLDDDDYPAYTMGRAADVLGTTAAFLRAVGEAELITPLRSEGGHRRYSRRQLRIVARARELVDQGTPIEAACRIVSLEDQLDDVRRHNRDMRRKLDDSDDSDESDVREEQDGREERARRDANT